MRHDVSGGGPGHATSVAMRQSRVRRAGVVAFAVVCIAGCAATPATPSEQSEANGDSTPRVELNHSAKPKNKALTLDCELGCLPINSGPLTCPANGGAFCEVNDGCTWVAASPPDIPRGYWAGSWDQTCCWC
jgi:hypothetical protein